MIIFNVTIPAIMYESASAIMRAIDQDTGGYNSFGSKVLHDEEDQQYLPEFYQTSMLCDERLINVILDPEALYDYICNDYSNRWQDLEVPSYEDVLAFFHCVQK